MFYEDFLRWIREISGHLWTQGPCEKVIVKEDPWQLYNEAVPDEPLMLGHVPNRFKTWNMCEGAVEKVPRMLRNVPHNFKIPEMCNKTVEIDPWQLKYVTEDLIIREMCNKAVDDCSCQLEHVSNQHKTRKMCNRAVNWHNLCLLQNIPNWFEEVIQQKIKILYNTGSFYDDSLIG